MVGLLAEVVPTVIRILTAVRSGNTLMEAS
jgi:hypothetical protein